MGEKSGFLQACGVSFSYGRRPVLCEVGLAIDRGEFLGLIGPNGSGKTTLVKILSGVLAPAGGRVTLDGRDLVSIGRRKIARRIAVVAQEERCPEGFAVEEIVLMGRSPYLRGMAMERSRDHEAAKRAMDAAGCLSLHGRRMAALSGGERRRVYIARALAQEPEILLMDEPTAHLDLYHQGEIMERLCERNRQGLTILMVTHDVNLAALYCGRMAALRDGRIMGTGRPEELMEPVFLETIFGCGIRVFRAGEHTLMFPDRRRAEPTGSVSRPATKEGG